MGAVDFQTTATGFTPSEAFRAARKQAEAYNGHQHGYSGDIQTCEGYRVVDSPETPKLGEWLKRARKLAGLTQGEAAEGLGVSTATYAKIERGLPTPRTKLTPEHIDRLAEHAQNVGAKVVGRTSYTGQMRLLAFGEEQWGYPKQGESVLLNDLKALLRGEMPPCVLNAYTSEALNSWGWLEKWGPCACVVLREPADGEPGEYLFFGLGAC